MDRPGYALMTAESQGRQDVLQKRAMSWPALVCSRNGFIEAIFVADPIPGDAQAVRMEQTDYDLYSSLLVDAALGRLGDSDRHLVEEFDTLLSLLEKSSIPLETVAA